MFAYMLSQTPTYNIIALGTMMHMDPFTQDSFIEADTGDENFNEVFQLLHGQIYIREGDGKVDYHL